MAFLAFHLLRLALYLLVLWVVRCVSAFIPVWFPVVLIPMLSCIMFVYASCIIFLAVLKCFFCTIMESWIGKISMWSSRLVSIICSIINASRFINVLQIPVQKASLIFSCFTFREIIYFTNTKNNISNSRRWYMVKYSKTWMEWCKQCYSRKWPINGYNLLS